MGFSFFQYILYQSSHHKLALWDFQYDIITSHIPDCNIYSQPNHYIKL